MKAAGKPAPPVKQPSAGKPGKPAPPVKQPPAGKPAPPAMNSKPMSTRGRPSATPTVPAKKQLQSLQTVHEELENNENSSAADAFIIDRPVKKSVQRKVTPRKEVVTRSQKILNRAASAPGQRRVSDFYFVDPNDSNNMEYLPDIEHNVTIATREVPCNCTIVISDHSNVSQNEGPRDVSSPTSDTQMFDYPMLSPINSIECIVITDSSQDIFS